MDDATAVALVFGVLFLLTVETVYLAMLIAPRRPTPYKLMRYEAGNPETGPAKAPLAMQYLGYLLMLVHAGASRGDTNRRLHVHRRPTAHQCSQP
jgi:NADH-quinone oxidoreductase subunit A